MRMTERYGRPEGGERGIEKRWRCLDGEYETECSLCTVPPGAGQEDSYALVGDAGRKNVEKKLRAHIARTSEWHDARVRMEPLSQIEMKSELIAHHAAREWRPPMERAFLKVGLMGVSRVRQCCAR